MELTTYIEGAVVSGILLFKLSEIHSSKRTILSNRIV